MARSKSKQKRKSGRGRTRRRRSPAQSDDGALAVFAHDVRTALTGILALGDLLASSNLGERERRWAAGIKASAEHLASLTTLVVDAAKADAGSLTLQREIFRPRRLIEALGESLAARAETKGLRAEFKTAEDLPELLIGDQVRLRAALENLIDNAVKFTSQGTVGLEVRAGRAGRSVGPERVKLEFIVSDSGIGLKPSEIKRLFRPFAQASAEIAQRYGGAGLGLTVAKTVAKLMGGDLTVTSMAGRGSRFCFSALLPVAAAETAGTAHGRQAATPARRLSILCAEDNPYGRVILNTILTELGHRADFVSSGEEAVTAAVGGYDVILMDIALTGIGGLEATRRIRALAEPARLIPIVGISGHGEPGDRDAARSAGMNFYLRKPISPSTLSEAIEAVTAVSSAES
jgi:two-component system, sensor histidine kinase